MRKAFAFSAAVIAGAIVAGIIFLLLHYAGTWYVDKLIQSEGLTLSSDIMEGLYIFPGIVSIIIGICIGVITYDEIEQL